MKLTLAVLMALLLTGCGVQVQVPPIANGPQSWGKGELYSALRNATIRGAATGQWLAKKYEKMDHREIQKLSKAEGEALIAAGYDIWTGQMKQAASVTPYRVEQLSIADATSKGKTYDSKGKEVPLTCLVSTGNGFFHDEVKKKNEYESPFANLSGRKREYVERGNGTVIITACAKQDNGTWSLSHVAVEKPKSKNTDEGGK